jgi:8-oxo-dGTP pyrophosphatase MutT (NUDIX family)
MADAGKPVTLHKRSRVFSNSKWHVGADMIEDGRTGATVEDYIVLERKRARPDMVSGVTILPIYDGHILLLRNYRHPVERYFWEAARGFVDPGEELVDAALREAREEIGLIAAAADVIPLGYCFPESSTMIARASLFAVEGRAIDGTLRDDTEPGLGETKAFSFAELEAMMAAHEIEDATTCIAIERFFRMR